MDVILLQNSLHIGFNFDIGKNYQPEKYRIHLIVDKDGYNVIEDLQQEKLYESITIAESFSFACLITKIKAIFLEKSFKCFTIVTNTEEAMPVCGRLRVHFDIDENDYAVYTDKDYMKKKLYDSPVHIPKHVCFYPKVFLARGVPYLKEITSVLGNYPLFAKPVNQCSSMNLEKFPDEASLIYWANEVCKHGGVYEIDEFISGVMYHCDSFIKNNKILFTQVSQNSRPCYDFTLGMTKGTIALPHDHVDHIALSECTQQALKSLGMPKGGVTHMEFIKTSDGKFYFIEVAHRPPGILIPKMYEKFIGVDIISANLLLQIDPTYTPHISKGSYAAWACFAKKPGTLTKTNQPEINSQYVLEWTSNIGDTFSSYPKHGRDYVGRILMWNDDFIQLKQDFDYINDYVACQIN